jgi:excinuclease UvrABC nuclease subunit
LCIVYRHLNNQGEVIYVGQTNSLYTRQEGHKNGLSHISEEHRNSIAKIEQFETTSQADSDLLEIYYINKYQPKYNKSWKHEKPMSLTITHPFIWEEYIPRIKRHKNH